MSKHIFFMTVCARLWICCAFSQAHRPQANGRVEVAGLVLKDIMRKVGIENGKLWIEILPCALWIRHDLIDPEFCYSPYQLLLGRERPGVGLPWAMQHELGTARGWVETREKMEEEIAKILRDRIARGLARMNKKRHERKFQVQDRVWLERYKGQTRHSPKRVDSV